MRLIFTLCFYLLIGQGSANATFIDYEFNTLTFSDGHELTGGFTIDDTDNSLVAVSVIMTGSEFNFVFDFDDFGVDGFKVAFDNMVFGDTIDEGFQIDNGEIFLATGRYGYDADIEDTCYVDIDEVCTGSLFTFTSTSSTPSSVDAPQAIYLLAFGLLFMFRRKIS